MALFNRRTIMSTATLVLLCACQVSGSVRVPRWVSDNMVLQSNAEYGSRSFINGMADPGEMVSVTIGNAAFPATADANGEWEIEANHGSGTVTVTGEKGDKITAENAASGDVFFCAGQSNMVFPLGLAFNFTQEAATLATYTNFRFFMTALDYSSEPQFDLKPDPSECDVHNASACAMSCAEPGMCNRWVTAQDALANNASYLSKFSAVCFMTARDIARMHTNNRPIGLVFSAWGGTRVEAWMSPAAIADASVRVVPGKTYLPTTQTKQNNVSVLYNAMVAPFNKLSIRAALWYQGEANCASALDATVLTDYYAEYLQAMIRDWRDLKRMGDFAFMPMMLPPSVPSDTPPDKQLTTGRPAVRLAELRVAPHSSGETDISGVPVTIDLGGASAWGFDHPPNKNEMSRRLALQTVHAAYAVQGRIPNAWSSGGDSLWTGPILSNITMSTSTSNRVHVRGGGGAMMTAVTITFEPFTAVGLALKDVHALNINGSANDCVRCCAGEQPFEVLVGGEWVRPSRQAITMPSEATVSISTSATPATITAVRYAWSDYVDCVLVNNDSLSLAPFLQNVTASKPITTVVDTTFARPDTPIQSPPMGFNSWNFYHCNIDENIVKSMADRFVSSGMSAVNYSYINIDDCWQVARDANGRIIEDPVRFPSGIKALTDYVHSKGLKFGLYTARGSGTCQGRPGSLNYELIDAATYCDWGIDYIKIDGCRGAQDPLTSWSRFHQGLSKCYNDTGKFIVQSVESCDSPSGCGKFVTTVANLWRTGGDVQNYWASIMSNIHKNDIMRNVAVPGHFNDPDMLQVGNVGLTPDEQRTHFSLWCIVGAPLLAGTDIIHASNETLEILMAAEVIAVNQDLGRDGHIQGIYVGAAGPTINVEVDVDIDADVDVDVDVENAGEFDREFDRDELECEAVAIENAGELEREFEREFEREATREGDVDDDTGVGAEGGRLDAALPYLNAHTSTR
eukprot:m.159215 g.159215  ORF g.159215 m.159215 type:complete len:969 (-) comp31127_c1_seq1:249-3155(-)